MKKSSGHKKRIWLTILLSFVILLFGVFLSAIAIFKHYYGMLNIELDESIYEEQTMADLEIEETEFLPEISETIPIPQETETETETAVGTEESVSTPSTERSESTVTEQTSSIQTSEVTAEQETTVIQTPQETAELFKDMEGTEKMFRLLLIGVDSRSDNTRGRSDTMILFHINPDTKKIVMTSLLRDIYIDNIPGYGRDRLNAAYAFGGAKLLTQTISKSFGIEVDKYVIVNFWMVRDVVDALGGVDADVTKEELAQINHNLREQNRLMSNPILMDQLPESSVGKMHLNGNQALAYARIRKIDSDFGRTGRQREIISASIEKVKKLGILEINDMLTQFLPRITTNLTEKDILSLLGVAIKGKDYSIESMSIPVEGTWEYAMIDEKAVIKIDFAANAKAWYKKVVGE